MSPTRPVCVSVCLSSSQSQVNQTQTQTHLQFHCPYPQLFPQKIFDYYLIKMIRTLTTRNRKLVCKSRAESREIIRFICPWSTIPLKNSDLFKIAELEIFLKQKLIINSIILNKWEFLNGMVYSSSQVTL